MFLVTDVIAHSVLMKYQLQVFGQINRNKTLNFVVLVNANYFHKFIYKESIKILFMSLGINK